jgi:prophage DNA circulation protein
MTNILSLAVGGKEIGKQIPVWRDNWIRAQYNGAPFFCEANSRESGRRIVEHEFPKKNDPYAEDMGRHAYEFTIRAYCIVYPRDDDDLYQRNYLQVRDRLMEALEAEGPGQLQFSTQPMQTVVVSRYRMTEEEKFGGYCTFDITFLEQGINPLLDPNSAVLTQYAVAQAAQALRDQVGRTLQPPNPSYGTGRNNNTASDLVSI